MVGDRWAKIGVALLSLWAAALVAPTAAPAMGNPDTGGFATFNLKASNGYSMSVLAASRAEYTRGQILLRLTRRNSSVLYLAPAKVTDTTIDADLGSLGRIALEFEPTGERRRAAPNCEPEEWVAYDEGSYVGEFEFRGEEGYADVSATRAALSLQSHLNSICGSLAISEFISGGFPGAGLTAVARRQQGKISLRVNQNRPGARVTIETSAEEKRGRIQIVRTIQRTYPATAFGFDPMLRSAVLSPPAPFSGSARFQRDAEADNRWTGSLAVDLPGNSNVSLTGAAFDTHLRHAHHREQRFRPTRAERPNLIPWLSTKPSPLAPS
ncbi:MAG TPA: hypothetical protein VGV69_11085 [Solirubrobacterales bacterium]|nr:hypothetical protein [Solirubrobacterales bacterium]